MQDIVVLNARSTVGRIALAGVVILAIVTGAFGVRWQLGIMLSGLTAPTDPNAAEIAKLAIGWVPRAPAASSLDAAARGDLAGFERTVRLSPYDYRWYAELGRALEQDEQYERAETAMLRSVELAPAYAYPRWQLGNFYLRRNQIDEATAQLRVAANDRRVYRDQVFSLVWDYFDKDPQKVEDIAGDSADARARLAYFFAVRGSPDDSFRNWNSMSESEKAANPEVAKAIVHGLFIQRKFPQSLEFSRQLGLDAEALPGMVTNGGFEKAINESADSRFGWQIVRTDSKLDVATDPRVKHDGNRSVRVVFKNYSKPDLYNIFQTVVVEPGTKYRLRFWLRTETLKSAGPPLIELVNANADMPLARSQAFPSGTNDWREMSIDLTVPKTCTAITIRTTREQCGDDCPMTGTLWYDDFELVKQ